MSGYYALDDDGTPREVTFEEWCALGVARDATRIIARDEFPGVRVSTVFLGIDHGFFSSVPVLWETMIFGGEHDQYQERYTSQGAALEGHARAVALVNKSPEVAP